MSQMRARAAAGIALGDTFIVSRTFSQEETQAFGHLTRDYNPVHYDEGFAEVKGFKGLICHGLLTGSLICQVGGQVGWLASGMEFKFKRPVYFGDTVTCRLTITKLEAGGKAEARALMTNQHGEEVVEARLEGILPGPAEREGLRRMRAQGDPSNPLA